MHEIEINNQKIIEYCMINGEIQYCISNIISYENKLEMNDINEKETPQINIICEG